jgi:5-methylcytosine-specific restriction endonuclease McrA
MIAEVREAIKWNPAIDMSEKTCNKCGEVKSLDQFQRTAANRDGLHRWCRSCVKTHSINTRLKNIEAEMLMSPDSPKKCGSCKEVKDLRDFHFGSSRCRKCTNTANSISRAKYPEKNKAYAARYHREHKQQRTEAARRHRAENKEWWKEVRKKYAKTEKGIMSSRNARHRRRAAVANGNVSTNDLVALKKKAKGRCYYCGEKCKSLTLDHIVPISKGGRHSLDNLVMSCQPCNRNKSDRDPAEYAKTKGMLLI